ncbi:hypothetical protein [Rhodococcus opacus]|uniref:Prevent-host-death family protein n=1 Tax=Rhodococcus opacus (strain B4) TaxID=632772 RepID=C1ASD7_RHOOB|nr:hypothetical protein [Rhodococcus opacus]BAH48386.1 hypothetical protein ROP_01390 [Rhodococcus opacus B4]
MSVGEVPFSDIQNKGKATLAEWQRSGARPLRVTRRDDEDLVLMTAVRADQEREVLAAATAMVEALLHSDDRVLVRKVVAAAFPWVSYLSGEELADFVDELIASLRAGSSLDNPAPPARTIETWRHTAEVYADPDLARILSAPSGGDFGVVPVPEL